MFILEVLIYALFTWSMYILGDKSYTTTKGTTLQNKMDQYLWMYLCFYVLICAIRYGVGADSISYALGFIHGNKYMAENNESEIVYNGFINLISWNGIHYTIGMGTLAFLQIAPIIAVLKRHKQVLKYLPIALFGSFYFLSLNNGVRQMVVACMFVYATRWIVERKWWMYLAFIIVARMIHSSAIVLAVLYFLPSVGKLAERRWLCTNILIGCLFIGFVPQFQFAIQRFESILGLLGYSGYTDRMVDILKGNTEGAQAFGLMKISYFMGFLAITLFGKELNKRYGAVNKLFNLWWFYAFLYGCLYFLFGSMSYLFQRPIMYLELFTLFMLSYILHYFRTMSGNICWINYKACYYLLIAIIWSSITWQIFKSLNETDTSIGIETTTYKTIINHEIK